MSEEKRCSCRCHTFGKRCAGFGPDDNSCCEQPHVMWDEWKTRIDPAKKKELMAEFRKQAEKIHSEGALNQWVSKMDIPDHIKKVMQHEIGMIGYHCANFEDVCEFDIEGTVDWALDEVLENFL